MLYVKGERDPSSRGLYAAHYDIMHTMGKPNSNLQGGTGQKLGKAVIVVTGVFSLVAIIITAVSIWLQTKNYRKPLLQRYVIRILVLVPFFSAASWASIVSLKASFWIDPFRDVYEVRCHNEA